METTLEIQLPDHIGSVVKFKPKRCVPQGHMSSPGVSVAVLADIISIAGTAPGETPHEPRPSSRPVSGEVESEYYLRFPIRDVPGVIGLISTALGNRGISISHATARLAEDRPGRGHVKILAHRCGETLLRRSLDQIARLPILDGKPVLLPIVNGEPSRPFPFPPPRHMLTTNVHSQMFFN